MSKLPLEMISDVLCRLPVKSFLRFRCTSKPFCSVIDSPSFAKLHLKCSVHFNSNQSLVLTSHHLYSVDLPSLQRAVEIHHPLKSIQGTTEVIGSCNGLLCLNNSDSELVIWNMSTGKHHRLPRIPIVFPNLRYFAYGFGYDSVHDDYKLMRIVRFGHLETQVMMFRLKSNSWERVAAFPYDLPPFRTAGVFADGALHWLITHMDTPDVSMAAFDLATEDYHLVPQPPVVKDGSFFVQMRVWESRLCAICSYEGKRAEIWVLKHKECWDRLLSISEAGVIGSSHCIVPVAYLSNGNELLLLQDNASFLCYDLKTNKVKNVRVRGTPNSFDALLYVESLVKPFPMINGDGTTEGKHESPKSKKNVAKRDGFLSKGFKLVL